MEGANNYTLIGGESDYNFLLHLTINKTKNYNESDNSKLIFSQPGRGIIESSA